MKLTDSKWAVALEVLLNKDKDTYVVTTDEQRRKAEEILRASKAPRTPSIILMRESVSYQQVVDSIVRLIFCFLSNCTNFHKNDQTV